MAFSSTGLGQMSRMFHSFYRECLIPKRWRNLTCPVLINTWEAMYFDVFHDRVVQLGKRAREIGVEMLVLDDGWFKGRNDDKTSLGDWIADEKKLPRGLGALIDDINSLGLKFGIWIEPEMVNVNSDLFREHPDWALQMEGRPRNEGRNQLVLDYTRDEVREHIFAKLKELLKIGNIEYVKWDMNRHLSEVYSSAAPPHRQGEIYHRQVLGVYKLWKDLTEFFPNILFESCSGGGGRFDPGNHYFSHLLFKTLSLIFTRLEFFPFLKP